jgi:uncharacterized protein YkvS
MRRPNAAGTWIALILLALSLGFIAFEAIGLSQAIENDASIVHTTLPFNELNVDLGPLSNIRSALAGILNKTPAEQPEKVQAVSDKREIKEKNYSVLVYIDKSNLLVEDDDGNVISKRTAGSDDAAAIREAININAQGTVLCIGNFSILSPIDNLKSDIILKGLPGLTVFDCSKMETTVFPCGCGGSGYAEYTAPLIDDVLEGSRAVKVKDATIYREGDFVKLIDNESIIEFKKGEILRIEKINGNEIIFSEAIRDDYTVENSANIRKLTMTDDVTIEGIKFIGPGEETELILFGLNLLDHFRFVNNKVVNFGRAAIYLSDSLDSVLENNTFENIYMTGFGYAISVTNACDDIYIKDNVFRVKGRHYITAGAGTGSRNSGGFPRNIIIVNNSFEDCIQEAINSHPPFIGPIKIVGNSFKSCGKGIEIANGNTLIFDNSFTKCRIGIQLLGDEERTHDIHSNEFEECEEKILIETSDLTVYGNICEGKFRINRNEIEFL